MIVGPLPIKAKQMMALPNHQKRSAPAPELSRHMRAKVKVKTTAASPQDSLSSQGSIGPSSSFWRSGMSAPAWPISALIISAQALPAGDAGGGGGVGLGA